MAFNREVQYLNLYGMQWQHLNKNKIKMKIVIIKNYQSNLKNTKI